MDKTIEERIAEEVVKMLVDKHALRTSLPFHLDKDKFHHILKRDIQKIAEEVIDGAYE